ncbi:MAG TPA: hypothetical protein VNW04_08375 [Puia sp.]|jgi:hypothetical protein|nr:hypothetical protein [Puia sp.]
MFNKFPIQFNYDGKHYSGLIQPLQTGIQHRIPTAFQVFLNNVYYGQVKRKGVDWETDSPKCAFMVDIIGNQIYDRYE